MFLSQIEEGNSIKTIPNMLNIYIIFYYILNNKLKFLYKWTNQTMENIKNIYEVACGEAILKFGAIQIGPKLKNWYAKLEIIISLLLHPHKLCSYGSPSAT